MHYYQFNIADYRKDTSHLIPIEHYIYRFLLDWYYLDEHPIPTETQQVLRRLNIGSEYNQNLLNVLSDFFELEANGYVHKRVEEEIASYHNRAHTSRNNGKLGGRPKKTQQVNFEKATNNQEPITNKPIINKQRATPISDDFVISERVQKWAEEKGYKNLDIHLENFIGSCKANGYKYIDWDSAFMNAVRNNWAKIKEEVKGEKLEWK